MNQISTVLNELQDDIIIERTSEIVGSKSETSIQDTKKTQTKVYVQQNDCFLETTRDKLINTISGNDYQYTHCKWNHSLQLKNLDTTIDIAILFQRKSHIISNLCCGLLGGISLMQLVLTYTLVKGSKHEIVSFIELYSKFGYVPSATFSILTTICLMFALDRVDLVTVKQLMKQEQKFYSNWTLLFLYTITFILSVLCFKFDETIARYPESKNLIATFPDLSVWRSLNLWRCIFGIIGWFFVCITRPQDLLEYRLRSLRKIENENNQNFNQ